MPASLEVIKIALQAYAIGDCEIALALAGPHIRWDERASRPDGDLVWGQKEVGRAMRRYLDGWEEYRFDLEDVAEVGPGRVVGICREGGRTKDGAAVDRRFGGLWLVEKGKIVSWATYLTPRDAVRAAKELLGGRVEPEQIKRTTAPASEPVAVAEREPRESQAAEPEPAEQQPSEPRVADPQVAGSRKRILTKSEEQKRGARARAKLRKQSSRKTA